jgi:hypothetical protein
MNASTKTRGRGRNAKPTRSEVNAAWGRLRDAADRGDIQASAALIALTENKPLHMDATAA